MTLSADPIVWKAKKLPGRLKKVRTEKALGEAKKVQVEKAKTDYYN